MGVRKRWEGESMYEVLLGQSITGLPLCIGDVGHWEKIEEEMENSKDC